MNLVEVDRALRKLRLSGMADVLETRLRHAQTERLPPLDLVATLVTDELQRREDRLLARRHKLAGFRDADRALDTFDFDFNKKMNRVLIYELATARFIQQREDALFLGPPGTGKSHLAQAIGRAAIQQGYRVVYREVKLTRLGRRENVRFACPLNVEYEVAPSVKGRSVPDAMRSIAQMQSAGDEDGVKGRAATAEGRCALDAARRRGYLRLRVVPRGDELPQSSIRARWRIG